jgi:hypothetical protein
MQHDSTKKSHSPHNRDEWRIQRSIFRDLLTRMQNKMAGLLFPGHQSNPRSFSAISAKVIRSLKQQLITCIHTILNRL